jgi:hypothetical protein
MFVMFVENQLSVDVDNSPLMQSVNLWNAAWFFILLHVATHVQLIHIHEDSNRSSYKHRWHSYTRKQITNVLFISVKPTFFSFFAATRGHAASTSNSGFRSDQCGAIGWNWLWPTIWKQTHIASAQSELIPPAYHNEDVWLSGVTHPHTWKKSKQIQKRIKRSNFFWNQRWSGIVLVYYISLGNYFYYNLGKKIKL